MLPLGCAGAGTVQEAFPNAPTPFTFGGKGDGCIQYNGDEEEWCLQEKE